MAPEEASSQDGQRPNELDNEPKQEHLSTGTSLEDQSTEEKAPKNSALIISCISCITFISRYLGGLVTVSVPAISSFVSKYALATGCTLLISGAVSDAVGSRPIFLIGCFLQSILCMACGLSATGTQLILFRVISGLATSLCLPSAMSLISEHFPAGKLRSLALAFMGGGQPVGFGVGILCGGVIADSAGWRWGFYSAAIGNTFAFLLSWWQIPRSQAGDVSWRMLVFGIDWVGAVAASAAWACFPMLYRVFPAETQGLAAGVFNTVSQIGKSFGLAIVALISNLVTGQQPQMEDKGSPEALIVGYRAAFWTLFGMNVASLVVSLFGLRKVGNIGKKTTQ
ncbi:major facilitator superfamily domain-containing protein [Aspergillus minisclerotigenes]|uniref:Major facilitator superfamily domain-containing protein n=1 Tax=Aspergillus minisclerotigenes TaxID=656917 RepID=A0A5N6J8P6_9EURO|nr:major facilitator superfamily domain-containing protein [Aspergillus minisclerotigenes]